MSITETKTPTSKNKITRRQMLKSVSTATALAVTSPVFGAEGDEEKWATDPDTAGLIGLPLAAVYIERAIAAMAAPGLAGRWQVTIHSGDPEQYWGFRQIDAANRTYLKADTYTGRSDDLSFVVKKPKGTKGGGFDYWNVESTGDYGADCELGRKLGEEYLEYIGKHPTNGNVSLLSCIVDSMMARRGEPRTSWGRHTTGVEGAFLTAVNGYAMATSKVVSDNREGEFAGKMNALDDLGVEFERLRTAERVANTLCVASGEGEAEGFAYDEACRALGEVCSKIAELPAQTLAHLHVKARALEWHAFPDEQEPATIDERLAFQLVRAILNRTV